MDEKIVSTEDIKIAEKFINLEFNNEKRELMLENVNQQIKSFAKLNEFTIDNSIVPALVFNPFINFDYKPSKSQFNANLIKSERPNNIEKLAYAPIAKLAYLIKNQIITSTELTKMYISRIKKYDKLLKCTITLTEEYAMEKAKQADSEISSGRYRGLLHGIPYGVKDLLSLPGYKTTWGAKPYQEQVRDEKAVVIQKLEDAGAILVAKLSMGALAWGDVWFGGTTKTPWNLEEGSSGSSAGSASATAAGLVAFSIGTETYGSIVSPSTKCGTTGLRPTFGRVSRYGAMALSWSMDKIGPICRSADDCAIVFNYIYGPANPPKDPSIVIKQEFSWGINDWKKLRIGYLKSAFNNDNEFKNFDNNVIEYFKKQNVDIIPVELPKFPVNDMTFILWAEAATAFDELTKSGKDDILCRQEKMAWPNFFRTARLVPAVEYIRANRLRTMLIDAMNKLFDTVDVIIAPSYSNMQITTNLTGHPCVVVPTGFRDNNLPASITFVSNLMAEEKALMVAKAFQDGTSFHLQTPELILSQKLEKYVSLTNKD